MLPYPAERTVAGDEYGGAVFNQSHPPQVFSLGRSNGPHFLSKLGPNRYFLSGHGRLGNRRVLDLSP